jgi:hypothetical protein
VWFAEALISATAAEVRRLIAQAKGWAEALGKPVALWLSDRQDAFVTGIAAEFPGVPHRYCQNHFLRDVAKPVLEADSHTKVRMRKKVRGLRKIEQAVLKRRGIDGSEPAAGVDAAAAMAVIIAPVESAASPADPAGAVVLDYCAAVRGILNDDQGGPLRPPGLRMARALDEVRESIQHNLGEKKQRPDTRRGLGSGDGAPSYRSCRSRLRPAISLAVSRVIEKKGGSRSSNSAAWPVASTGASTK